MNYNWHNGWGGGSWVWMTIMMVVFWGGLTWFAVSLLRRGSHTPHLQTHATPPPPPLTPREILSERLARGEIEPDDDHRRPDSLERGKSRSDQQVSKGSRA